MKRQRLVMAAVLSLVAVHVWRASAQPPPEKVEAHGSVVDQRTNQPVAQARVNFRPDDPTLGPAAQSPTTNEQGRFSVEAEE